MPMILEEKKNILDFARNLSGIIKEQKWISHYDTESDSFVIRNPHLSEDSRKKYFNDEFAFYVNKKSQVEGIFIEYFISNFISHHKDFKFIIKDFKNKKENLMVIELKKSEIKKITPELESVIINSLVCFN